MKYEGRDRPDHSKTVPNALHNHSQQPSSESAAAATGGATAEMVTSESQHNTTANAWQS